MNRTRDNPKGVAIHGNSAAALPSVLLINGERWILVDYDYAAAGQPEIGGQTDCDRRIIFRNPNEEITQDREDMWHEVFHAALCRNSVKGDRQANWEQYADTTDHKYVYLYGQFMEGFVHDNPDFVRWAELWGNQ